MLLKPETLLQGGGYSIVRALDQSDFSITYEAEEARPRQKVLVKEFFMKSCCVRENGTDRVAVGVDALQEPVAAFRMRFLRDAQALNSIRHPHIVPVLDVFEENGTAYCVMPAFPGGVLSDEVRKGPLPERRAVKYIRQVAAALERVCVPDAADTVHLDMDPSHILLVGEGNVLLTGLDRDVTQFTSTADICSLGSLLYYLVTGTPPAGTPDGEEMARTAGVSPQIGEAVEKAMQPRWMDRPRTIPAFLALLDGIPDEAEPESGPQPAPKPQPDPAAGPRPELEALLEESKWSDKSLWGKLLEKNIQPAPEPGPVIPDRKVRTPREKKKKRTGLWVGLGIGLAILMAGGAAAYMFLEYPDWKKAKSEEAELKEVVSEYKELVADCRDSIDVWNSAKGTVPVEALEMVRKVKKFEDWNDLPEEKYGKSSELAEELMEKMMTAMDQWETAGDAQRAVDPDKALTFYQFSLEMARETDSLGWDILEKPENVRTEGANRRIRNKIRAIEDALDSFRSEY